MRNESLTFCASKKYDKNVKSYTGGVYMAKMGRPKVAEPMDCKVSVRMTEKEKKLLVEVADEVGLSHSETVKAALELYYKSLKKK